MDNTPKVLAFRTLPVVKNFNKMLSWYAKYCERERKDLTIKPTDFYFKGKSTLSLVETFDNEEPKLEWVMTSQVVVKHVITKATVWVPGLAAQKMLFIPKLNLVSIHKKNSSYYLKVYSTQTHTFMPYHKICLNNPGENTPNSKKHYVEHLLRYKMIPKTWQEVPNLSTKENFELLTEFSNTLINVLLKSTNSRRKRTGSYNFYDSTIPDFRLSLVIPNSHIKGNIHRLLISNQTIDYPYSYQNYINEQGKVT